MTSDEVKANQLEDYARAAFNAVRTREKTYFLETPKDTCFGCLLNLLIKTCKIGVCLRPLGLIKMPIFVQLRTPNLSSEYE